MALVGLMQTLSIEGAKHDIRVNCLAPTAATRMTENLLPEAMLKLLEPEAVTPGLLALVARMRRRGHPLRRAGSYERAHITLTQGIHVGAGGDAAEQVAARLDAISDREVSPCRRAAPRRARSRSGRRCRRGSDAAGVGGRETRGPGLPASPRLQRRETPRASQRSAEVRAGWI
jgi:hypothetical protein